MCIRQLNDISLFFCVPEKPLEMLVNEFYVALQTGLKLPLTVTTYGFLHLFPAIFVTSETRIAR